jgi:hypothetical protein
VRKVQPYSEDHQQARRGERALQIARSHSPLPPEEKAESRERRRRSGLTWAILAALHAKVDLPLLRDARADITALMRAASASQPDARVLERARDAARVAPREAVRVALQSLGVVEQGADESPDGGGLSASAAGGRGQGIARRAAPRRRWSRSRSARRPARSANAAIPLTAILVLDALGPSSPAFRGEAARALAPIAARIAPQSITDSTARSHRASIAEARAAHTARAALAKLVADWQREYAEREPGVARAIAFLRSTQPKMRDEVDRLLRAEDAASVAHPLAGSPDGTELDYPQDIAALENLANSLCSRADHALAEIRDLFSILGEEGIAELTRGGSDGIQATLRDIWARLRRLDGQLDECLRKIRLLEFTSSLDIVDDDGRTLHRHAGASAARVQAVIARIDTERTFVRSVGITIPGSASSPSGDTSKCLIIIGDGGDQARAGNSQDDEDEEEGNWDEAVEIGD